MSLFAAIIRPDVGSIPHTEYLVDIFLNLSVYSNLGLKALLSRAKRRKGLECACPTWRAWLGLPFHMLIPSAGENLGSRAHATNLEGEVFLPHIWTQFWLWDPICAPKLRVLDKVWIWVVKDSLRAFVWYARRCTRTQFGSEVSHRVSLVDVSHLPLWATIWDWRPSIFNDFVRTVTNVSANREDYR